MSMPEDNPQPEHDHEQDQNKITNKNVANPQGKEGKSEQKIVVEQRKSYARLAVDLATGTYSVKRAVRTVQNLKSGIEGVKNVVTKDEKSPTTALMHEAREGFIDGRKAKYAVYSHTKKHVFYGDDFSTCLDSAYDEIDIELMILSSTFTRRIQSYGAIFVALTSVIISIKMKSLLPLSSLFPAVMLCAFAIRRACFEISLEQKKPVGLTDFISKHGFHSIWK